MKPVIPIRARVTVGTVVIALAMAAGAPVGAQSDEDPDGPVARVVAALEAGDANALLTEAGQRVELVIFERGGLFSRGQAELVLAGFFRRHPAERVVLSEQSLTDEERAAMGRYFTRDGEAPLRVYVRFRPGGGEWSLDAVRIERPTVLTSGGAP